MLRSLLVIAPPYYKRLRRAPWILNLQHIATNYNTSFNFLYSSPFGERIETVKYENQSSKTISIRRPYSYLSIIALNSGSGKIKFQIFSMEMYHYVCDKTTKFNANLNEVHSSTANISKPVQCLNNAIGSDSNSTNITVTCTPEGEWIAKKDDECECIKGFYFDSKQCSCKYRSW